MLGTVKSFNDKLATKKMIRTGSLSLSPPLSVLRLSKEEVQLQSLKRKGQYLHFSQFEIFAIDFCCNEEKKGDTLDHLT